MVRSSDPRESSPLETALEHVGDRWSLLLVEALLVRPHRFNELLEAVPGIAPNILTDRVRRLERERLIVATQYQARPPRMSYALTSDGRDLASALRLLADWGARRSHGADGDASSPIRHSLCGTPLEAHLFCATCDVRVDAPDAETLVTF